MQSQNGDLISNDPLVSAIFNAVDGVPSQATEKLRAISRAGKIAEAYLAPNLTDMARETVLATFKDSASSPSE
jgi:hypothetical protein